MIEPTDKMRTAFREAAEGLCTCSVCLNHRLAAVFAIVARDRCLKPAGHVFHPLQAPPATCRATVETKGTVVRCGKPADAHDAHLGRHCGWDVIW